MDLKIRFVRRGSLAKDCMAFSSSVVNLNAAKRSSFLLMWFASMIVENTGKPFLAFNEASKLLRYIPVTSCGVKFGKMRLTTTLIESCIVARTTSSPGFAESIRSPSRIISLCRGKRPAGTEPGDSCKVIL